MNALLRFVSFPGSKPSDVHALRRSLSRLVLASSLAWSAAAGAQGTPGDAPAEAPSAASAKPDSGLPAIEMTSDILRQLLLAEIAHQRGYSDPAYNTLMDLARSTRDPRIARRAMQVALERGQAQKGLDAATLWSLHAPDSQEAKRYVQLLNAAVGRIEPLMPALREQLAKAPDKAQAISAVAGIVGQSSDKQRVFTALDDLLRPYQDLVAARIALARAAGLAQQFARAESEALAALKLRPGWEYAALLAFDYGSRVHPEEALAHLKDFVREHPKALETRIAYARALAALKKPAEAKAEFEGILRDAPGNLEVLQRLGVLAYQAQDLAAAEKYFRRFVEDVQKRGAVERELAAGYGFLAQIAEDQKRYDEAIQWLNRIQGGEARFSAQLRQAILMGRQGKVDEARALLQSLATANEPQRVQRLIAESQILRDAKRPEEAYGLLKKATQDMPDNPELLYDYAMAGERVGKFQEMEEALRKVIALKPDNAHAYNALGYSLADRNLRLEEAGVLLEKAVALAPDDAFILDSLGWLQYRQGKLDDAVRTLKKAYAQRPDAEIAVHLGEVLWVSGDAAGARSLWNEASKKEPANETLRATLVRFNVKL